MKDRKTLGKNGEDAVCAHLETTGRRVVERNFFCRAGEIDIIARERDTVLFVEVKTRSSGAFGTPGEAVTLMKQGKIRQTAQEYILKRELDENQGYRFDVAEVYKESGGFRINYIENAFD